MAVAHLILVRSHPRHADTSVSDLSGRGGDQPGFLDALFVVGDAASVLLHAKIYYFNAIAVDHGCHRDNPRNSLRPGVAPDGLSWSRIKHHVLPDFSRNNSPLLLQRMASPHTQDLTNR